MPIFATDDLLFFDEFFYPQCIENVNCENHLHLSGEILIVTLGKISVNYMGTVISLSEGHGIYIPPSTPHSFDTPHSSRVSVFTFSLSLVSEFASYVSDKDILTPTFSVSKEVLALCDNYEYNHLSDLFCGKTILYPLCYEVSRKCEFSPSQKKSSGTFSRIVRYMNENCAGEITLETTARSLGLNHKYLSRMFKVCGGMCFSDYLNGLRCSRALKAMADPMHADKTLAEIALDCGFGSIRTFNRVFYKTYLKTPKEMRTFISGQS